MIASNKIYEKHSIFCDLYFFNTCSFLYKLSSISVNVLKYEEMFNKNSRGLLVTRIIFKRAKFLYSFLPYIFYVCYANRPVNVTFTYTRTHVQRNLQLFIIIIFLTQVRLTICLKSEEKYKSVWLTYI